MKPCRLDGCSYPGIWTGRSSWRNLRGLCRRHRIAHEALAELKRKLQSSVKSEPGHQETG